MGSPEIEWEGSTPHSSRFGDIYFSPQNGFAETEYVFVQGGGLRALWEAPAEKNFTLFELGFGSGLNFVATVESFLKTAPSELSLHYTSIEKYPFSSKELARALMPFGAKRPMLREITEELGKAYPAPISGFHRLVLCEGRVFLTLLFGEAKEMLQEVSSSLMQKVHLWYLDGFDPAKNPEMWQEELFHEMARLSAAGARVTTFTAAGFVRRGLEAAGFCVTKIPGFGKKREMITAEYQPQAGVIHHDDLSAGQERLQKEASSREQERSPKESQSQAPEQGQALPQTSVQSPSFFLSSAKGAKPWYEPPPGPFAAGALKKRPSAPKNSTVAIIGAGLAGCALVEALSRRGVETTLIEKESDLATAASGNPRGIFFPILHAKATPIGRFSLAAFEYTLSHLQRLEKNGQDTGFLNQGLLHLCQAPDEMKKLLQNHSGLPDELVRLVDAKEANQIAGVELQNICGARHYPRAGSLSPRALCLANLNLGRGQSLVETIFGREVAKIERAGENWCLYDAKGGLIKEAGAVVMANSYGALEIKQSAWLPLGPFRGQLILTPESALSSSLKSNINGEIYLTPAFDYAVPGDSARQRVHVAGASFDRLAPGFGPEALEINLSQSEALLKKSGGLTSAPDREFLSGEIKARVSVRSAGIDHSPLIGPLLDEKGYLKAFAGLAHGESNWLKKNGHLPQPEAWHPEFYFLGGIGSRGIIYSQLGAEMIAAMICGEMLPVEASLARAFAPARFLYRKIKRGRM